MLALLADTIDRAQVARALERVFARGELRPPEEGWLAQRLQELADWVLGNGPSAEVVGWILLVLVVLVVGMVLAWVGVQVRRGLLARSVSPRAPAASAAAAIPPSTTDRLAELRRRAQEARARGDLVQALRLTFFALLVGLGRSGDLEYRDVWTARELVERGHPAPELAGALAPLVRWIDERTFGHRDVTPDDVDELEALCARWLDGRGAAG